MGRGGGGLAEIARCRSRRKKWPKIFTFANWWKIEIANVFVFLFFFFVGWHQWIRIRSHNRIVFSVGMEYLRSLYQSWWRVEERTNQPNLSLFLKLNQSFCTRGRAHSLSPLPIKTRRGRMDSAAKENKFVATKIDTRRYLHVYRRGLECVRWRIWHARVPIEYKSILWQWRQSNGFNIEKSQVDPYANVCVGVAAKNMRKKYFGIFSMTHESQLRTPAHEWHACLW